MSRDLVIALDQGSSSSRALAIDSRGRVVAKAQFPIKSFYPLPGWIEHDALDIARTQEKALDSVLSRIPKSAHVLGLGIASQRSTVVFWDRETAKPVARVPSWQDGRAASVVAPMQDRHAEAHDRTGLYLTPYYSAPKIRWFLDNVPAVKAARDSGRLMAGPVATYLIWRLTKGEVYAADPSTAQRMMLMNLATLRWDEEMLKLFAVPREILPRILPSAGTWGETTRGGRRIPLLACVGDQQAATIGLGAMEAGSSVANYGTGAFFLHNSGSDPRRIPGLLTSVGWQIGDSPPSYLQEGTVHAAGASFDWLRDGLGVLRRGADVDALCRKSKQRVLALQAIGGLGAPRWDYVTKTAFFGLSSQTKAEDIVRGVTEGIAFLIADVVGAMRSAGLSPGNVRASGGLSRIDHLLQFEADILGLELARCRETEATALGAASLAAEAAGADWAGRLSRTRADKVFRPTMARGKARELLESWGLFVAAQAKLSREVKLS